MITIEHLEVLFDAEEQRDEVVFAHLFARHIEAWERRREREREAGEQAQRERRLPTREAYG